MEQLITAGVNPKINEQVIIIIIQIKNGPTQKATNFVLQVPNLA